MKTPIAFFDLESTGKETTKAKIVSIAIIKYLPDGSQKQTYNLVNPGCPIPAEATAVHGITDEMVKDKPLFSQLAKPIFNFLSDCEFIGGFNVIEYDLPLLIEEFARVDLAFDYSSKKYLDSCRIFKKKEERTLSAAVKFYLNREMEGAHDALADTAASVEVFSAQVAKYDDLKGKSLDELAEYCLYDGPRRADPAGRILIDSDGDYIFAGGKHKDKKCKTQIGYLKWMLSETDGTYTITTKNLVKRIIDELTTSNVSNK